ncbi:MAG TPA: DUF2203 family protein, partial [Acidimicrobiales bacterium]|nr:DUF2203 family protein [Acidimicrobiales bacterium]
MDDWTEEGARAYLPRLRELLDVLRRAANLGTRARSNGHGAVGEDAKAALAEIEDRGIVLRDLDRGIVDFPSRHPNGRAVLLCWQSGEDDLSWWHLP